MISKAKQKFLKALQSKKNRYKHQSFLVQGTKSVLELLRSGFQTTILLATPEFISSNGPFNQEFEIIEATPAELREFGTLETNETAMAVARMKVVQELELSANENGLMLDDIRDPGNLGTILRTADWFGIKKVIVSEKTTDLYNPKVINATMGSFTRVKVMYCDLRKYMLQYPHVQYSGMMMDGTPLSDCNFKAPSMLVLGSESHGIRSELIQQLDQRTTIPGKGLAESLNVAVAAGIGLSYLSKN